MIKSDHKKQYYFNHASHLKNAYITSPDCTCSLSWKQKAIPNVNQLVLIFVLFKGALMQIWKSANIFSSYESNMMKISHYNTFYFVRCAHVRYVKSLRNFLRNLQTSRANNSTIPRIKNVKFSRHCFYMNTNI